MYDPANPSLSPDPAAGAGLYPFEQRQQQIKRRQAMLAQAIRDAQRGYVPQQGQMVSGHYVAPSWAQHLNSALAPMLDQQRIDSMGASIDADTAAYDAADRKAAIAHAMNAPGAMGPASPETTAQWQQEGLAIPSRKDVIGKLIQDQTINAPIRQEQRAEKQQDREDRQAEAEKLRKMQEAEFERQRIERGEQLAADRVERERQDRMRSEDRAADREARSADRRATIEGALERSKLPKGKAMTDKARSDLDAYDSMREGLAQGIAALEKSTGKGMGWAAGVAQNLIPGGQSVVAGRRDQGTNDAIQMITYTTDEIRHGRFGSALTATEKASAGQYLPTEHDTKDQVLAKAKGLQKLLDLNHRRLTSQGGASSTWGETTPAGPKVRTFNPATGRLE